MNRLIFTLWDVGHGLSATLFTPVVKILGINRRRLIQFDVSNNSQTGFSPVNHLYNTLNWRTIDHLILSHPDQDHIGDLPALDTLRTYPYNQMTIRALSRNKTIPSHIISVDIANESRAKTTYRQLDSEYVFPLTGVDELTAVNFGGAVIHQAWLPYENDMDENDCSLLFTVQFDNLFLIIPGDMTSYGFTKLVEQNQLVSPNPGQTVVLIAPHHGSDTAEPEAFLHFYKPNIVLAGTSDADTNSDPLYRSNLVGGYYLFGETIPRKFLGTRNAADINISVTPGQYPVISLENH